MTETHVPRIVKCPRGCGELITPGEWNPQTKRCKYCPPYYGNAESVTEPSVTFSSQKEYRRAKDLQALSAAGKITHLRFYASYDLVISGVSVGRYIANFDYDNLETGGQHITEDVKSPDVRKTQDYRRSKKLMKKLYGIEIVEL